MRKEEKGIKEGGGGERTHTSIFSDREFKFPMKIRSKFWLANSRKFF